MSIDDEEQWLAELDEDFGDDPDYQALAREEKIRIVSVLNKMLDMGMAAVYGDEAPDEPDADVPCQEALHQCRSKCCTCHFALTKDEVRKGIIEINPEKPFFIARDADGYCPHLDRDTLQCKIWDDRPLRCRRYDCREDADIDWPQVLPSS